MTSIASSWNFRIPDAFTISKILNINNLKMVGATGFEPVTSTV